MFRLAASAAVSDKLITCRTPSTKNPDNQSLV